ncbi:MAG: 2,3-bisphosphoglycerate-independent phosphoglycerate mutase [Candidatus Thermoplasmatota archaeon]|nr:2,3-bisphosphoglycerate-independent phosphoglycerate mutase [Candidatus Thermoplasmatota archaeon]
MPIPKTKRMLLVVLDGWGHSDETEHNAVRLARTPNFTGFFKGYPSRFIEASQEAVGLPKGQMGNSEVGHLTLGAGRVVYQPLVKISKAVEEGSFRKNRAFVHGMDECRRNGGTLHLMGLMSKGGVHSHMQHLYALIDLALDKGLERIRIHAITDGRDVPQNASLDDMMELTSRLKAIDPRGRVKVASVMGRFFAMDRDHRWDRTELAYLCYTEPIKSTSMDPVNVISASYAKGATDEFISPVQIVNEKGEPEGLVKNGDTLIFFNFRPDRARQITKAFIYPFFDGFLRTKMVKPHFIAMTDYDTTFFTHIAFKEPLMTNTTGEVISRAGLKQLRIAETEKYAHVTFFFSGGREETFENEERVLVPSPKVKTYDLQPEMSARTVADRAEEALKKRSFDLVVLNFANPDMVGHTGIESAAIKAVETVDECLGRVVSTALDNGYHIIVTADHGNAEQMWNYEKGSPFTAHTTNPVPLIYIGKGVSKGSALRDGDGSLADIAPTILKQLDLIVPEEMTGTPYT